MTGERRHSLASQGCSNGGACPLGYPMHQLLSNVQLREPCREFSKCHGNIVMVYIDDIVIATETIEDHNARVKEVFECLREAGFKMRAEKCDFMRTETQYLGRVVSAGGIRPDPEAVIKIQEWLPPRNKEKLRSFLEIFPEDLLIIIATSYRSTHLRCNLCWN